MNTKTEDILNNMLEFAKKGNDIHPFMFQPRRGGITGTSNNVSAAIRIAKKRGLLVEAGKDGNGKPFYRAAVPVATHSATSTIQ